MYVTFKLKKTEDGANFPQKYVIRKKKKIDSNINQNILTLIPKVWKELN